MVAVPVYDTFKASFVIEILQESKYQYFFAQKTALKKPLTNTHCNELVDACVIVTDSNERAKQLINIGRTQSLHSIIITSENIHPETQAYAKNKGIKLYPFTEVEVRQIRRAASQWGKWNGHWLG